MIRIARISPCCLVQKHEILIATILDLQQLFIFIYYTTSQVISFISINGSMTCYMLLLCQCPHLEGTMNIFLVLVKTHHYCQYSD